MLILTDPGLVDTDIPHRIGDRLGAYEISTEIFPGVHVEPTDDLMREIGIPNGIGGGGYTADDVPDLVAGTLQQQRLLATCAKTPTEADIADILTRSMTNW